MESFPEEFRYEPNKTPNNSPTERLNVERAVLYAEIKYNETGRTYAFTYNDRLYDNDLLFILLDELYSRYPERIALSFRYKKGVNNKIPYKEFIQTYKGKDLKTFVSVHIQLRDYPTNESFCEYHGKVHQKEDFEMSHSLCKRHGHCLYPIGCPLIGKCAKEFVKNA